MADFTHIDNSGKTKMVDVSGKIENLRAAVAQGFILVNREIIEKIKRNELSKGDVFTTAKLAGINAAKKNWDLIPLCHQIRLTNIDISFEIIGKENKIMAMSTIKGYDRTGVEMEALTAVSVSLLAIYDMCKAVSKDMIIGGIELVKKTGGKADYER
jgi:cyclic pyranopterin phosphate synthase